MVARILILLLFWASQAMAHESQRDSRLPLIGPAPDFALTSQDGLEVRLADYRGKVVALTFIFTSCADTCPLLTEKMARIQDSLGLLFGKQISFISITVDPERDTPAVLKGYAETYGANLAGWAFLTGDLATVREVGRQYGIYAAKATGDAVDHTFLTSLIDSRGDLRVQYLGVRFDSGEFRRDLIGLMEEPQ